MNNSIFSQHIIHMPVTRLIDFIYWDNHGGDNMDIKPEDWTIAMVWEALREGYTLDEFSHGYAMFLEDEK